MKEADFQENERLQLAFDYVYYTGRNVFLTGKAGTGKTTFLKKLRKTCPKRMVVTSPTGVAAVMVGRAALTNPAIFAELKGAPHSVQERQFAKFHEHVEMLKALHAQISAHFPGDHLPSLDVWISMAARTHLFRYFSGMRGAGGLRRRLSAARTLADVMSAVNDKVV